MRTRYIPEQVNLYKYLSLLLVISYTNLQFPFTAAQLAYQTFGSIRNSVELGPISFSTAKSTKIEISEGLLRNL